MSPEVLADSPLDKCRRINKLATHYDAVLLNSGGDEEAAMDISNKLLNINDQHPFIGRSVIAIGNHFKKYYDEDNGIEAFVAENPSEEPSERVEGEYKGCTVLDIYDPDTDTSMPRVVHVVELPDKETFYDSYFRVHEITDFVFMSANEGMALSAISAYDCHSLSDLKGDVLIDEVVEVASKDLELVDRIKRIGGTVNKILHSVPLGVSDISRQRISYINSLGLLTDTTVTTKDMIVLKPDTGTEVWTRGNSEEELEFIPEYFAPNPSYTISSQGLYVQRSQRELFVRGALITGEAVLTPTRRILSVK